MMILPLLATGTTTSADATSGMAFQMIGFGLIILAAHLGGKLCQRINLSEVTGQLLGGALVSPFALHIMGFISGDIESLYWHGTHSFHFFVFVFLSMVAFGIGEELHISRLKKVGKSAVIICLIQGGLTWFLISAAFYFTGKDLLDSMLIGSIGIATAPAVTFVLMNKMRIEGRLRHVLGSLVVLDDLIEVIIFSILMQVALKRIKTGGAAHGPVYVIFEIGMAIIIGGGIYLLLKLLVRKKALSLKSHKHRQLELRKGEAFLQRMLAEHPSPSVEILLLVMGSVAIGAGLAYYNHWPFLITATFSGFLIANFHSQAIFDSLKLENIAPVLNLAFFALIGANIDLSSLTGASALLALLYVVSRMVGKLVGTWVGCKIMKESKKITSCLPTLMLPQAGVAAVEAVLAATILNKPEIAIIILPAIVFFEVFGVFLVDNGLKKWRKIDEEELKAKKANQIIRGPSEAARILLANLTAESVIVDLQGNSKEKVIEELVDHAIKSSDQHIDRIQTLQVLGERENMSSTGIGNGIAIPHCRLMGLEKPVLVFGIHRTGIEFAGVDNEPCKIFLLMLTCTRDPGEHLRLLSAASHILSDKEVRNKKVKVKSPEEFISILESIAKL